MVNPLSLDRNTLVLLVVAFLVIWYVVVLSLNDGNDDDFSAY